MEKQGQAGDSLTGLHREPGPCAEAQLVAKAKNPTVLPALTKSPASPSQAAALPKP